MLTCSKAVRGLKQVHLRAETSPRPGDNQDEGEHEDEDEDPLRGGGQPSTGSGGHREDCNVETGVQQIPEMAHGQWVRDDVR